MSIKQVLSGLDLVPSKEELSYLKEKTEKLTSDLRAALKKDKIDADVFVGGSFAKGTLIGGEFYDIDIFVRFNWKYENISEILRKTLGKITKKNKMKLEVLHGSRDYFRIILGKKAIFEIVPVVRIKRQKEARNVTDLSYFHVNYVKRKLGKNLAKEVVLAKQFCKAQKVYGAESYVNGFSGYALECLIIYYKSFEKMLRELIKIKPGERIIIDSEKAYGKKTDVLFEMNESKLNSPVIVVDPTWKERNALAALSRESFAKFQEAASNFLKNPSGEFFEIKKFGVNEFRKRAKKNEFVSIELETKKQPGDIAGTKMKKFSNYIVRELGKYFEVIEDEFEYSGENKARLYLIAKPKKEIIKIGPPASFEKHASAFRKQNKNVYEKNKVLYARIKINFSAKKFLKDFARNYKNTVKGMGISGLEIK
jgi:tRNA nucleotidyltransferase (CCA-adding enzyme)